MDLNGTLRTSQVLDYESNASHLILVRAYDLNQSYVEGNFTVTVLDVNESVPNSPPSHLVALDQLAILENEPVGTVVGRFPCFRPRR